MSLLSKFLPSPIIQKGVSTNLSGGGSSLYQWGMTSLAGEVVSPSSAAQVAAVFCAMKILSETIGMISLDMYEKSGDSVKSFPKHPLQFRLHDEPNDEQTAIEWRMQMTSSMALWGNGYSEKIMRGKRLAALKFKSPQATSIRRTDSGKVIYRYYPLDGRVGPEDIPAQDMFHPKTISIGGSGLEGTSPIVQVRNAFGLAMALERFGSRFFANGAVPGGVLTYPEVLSDEANRNLRESWKKLYGGSDNASEIAILEEGMKYQQVGVDPEKAQAIESRSFQVREIARVFRIPLHMLYENDQEGHNTTEQNALEFVKYTLMPWIRIWEQSLNRSLLQPEEKGKVFCAFNLEDLLKGDTQTRFAAYAVARNWGWYTPNDILKREHMNPREDEDGDAYLQPMNMAAQGEDIPKPLPAAPLQVPNRGPRLGGGKPPATGAGPNNSTVPPTGVPVKPGKKAMEMVERVQDIVRESKKLSKLLEGELAA